MALIASLAGNIYPNSYGNPTGTYIVNGPKDELDQLIAWQKSRTYITRAGMPASEYKPDQRSGLPTIRMPFAGKVVSISYDATIASPERPDRKGGYRADLSEDFLIKKATLMQQMNRNNPVLSEAAAPQAPVVVAQPNDTADVLPNLGK